MAEDFFLDQPGMQDATRAMRAAGTNLRDAFKELDAELTRYVGCWGDDEIGKAFEGNYWPNAVKMTDAYRPAGERIEDDADLTQKNIDYFASLDLEHAKRIDSMKPE